MLFRSFPSHDNLTFTVGTGATTLGSTLDVAGLATFNGGLTISNGNTFLASGAAVFAPSTGNNVVFNTSATERIQINGLQTQNGNTLCLDGSNNLAFCNGAPFGLQAAYNTGNTITTTPGRNLAFTLGQDQTTSLTLTNLGTASAFIINDNNANINTSLDIQSSGSSTLTINELGNITTSGNIATTGTGTITSNGLLTASNGLTLTTGAINLTATSGTLNLTGLSASSLQFGANNLLIGAGNFNVTATGINNTAIGSTTPSTGNFTNLTTTGTASFSGDLTLAGAPRSIQTTEIS